MGKPPIRPRPMGNPPIIPAPSENQKNQANQPGGGTPDGAKIDLNYPLNSIQIMQSIQLSGRDGGEETDIEKPSPDTEVPIANPEKMVLKDIKGMV